MLKKKYWQIERRQRYSTLPNLLILLGLVVFLAACDTAENGSGTTATTAVPVEPTVAVVETPVQTEAVPTPELPTVAVVDEATVVPTIPPELVPTEPPPTPETQQVMDIQLTLIASGFEKPTFLTHAGDGRLFVSEQVGRISIIENGQTLQTPFLNIQNRVGSVAFEQGLLSFVFSPNYALDGSFYVNYTDLAGSTVISRFQVNSNDPNSADQASEQIIMTLAQPFENHNGGQLQFGPDGYLYIGTGDGGSAGDPENNGQNPNTLLGALLRIDVNSPDSYTIPADNPFVDDPTRADEIWAYGLRNPWRFSFDRLTSDLYISDVGQTMWEEVNFQSAISPGGQNYGWNIMEGEHCYESVSCDPVGMSLPVAEYSHDFGCSITGGYIYRGSQFPTLTANYFFADYCTGYIWGLYRQGDGSWAQSVVLQSGHIISSFGEDMAGEIYVLEHSTGEIFQIQPVN